MNLASLNAAFLRASLPTIMIRSPSQVARVPPRAFLSDASPPSDCDAAKPKLPHSGGLCATNGTATVSRPLYTTAPRNEDGSPLSKSPPNRRPGGQQAPDDPPSQGARANSQVDQYLEQEDAEFIGCFRLRMFPRSPREPLPMCPHRATLITRHVTPWRVVQLRSDVSRQ